MQIQDIKKRLSILKVLGEYGLHPDRNGMLCCPFHEDKPPSLKIYDKTDRFHYFGRGKSGDVIEFIQLKNNCNKHQAIEKAKELCWVIPEQRARTKEPREEKQEDHQQIIEKVFGYFKNGINSSKPAKAYAEKRSLELFLEIGYKFGREKRAPPTGSSPRSFMAAA